MKPTLKASGTKRLTLKSDEPLSNVAFKFNLRHYNQRFGFGGAGEGGGLANEVAPARHCSPRRRL
jgi:hypothetical protein